MNKNFSPRDWFFFSGKRSPYSPLIIVSTNLHSVTSNGLSVFEGQGLQLSSPYLLPSFPFGPLNLFLHYH